LYRKIFKYSSFNILAQIIVGILGLSITPFILKGLGTTAYGAYTLSATIIIAFNYLNLGVGPTVTKEVAVRVRVKKGLGVNSIILNSLFVTGITSILLSVLLYFLAPYITKVIGGGEGSDLLEGYIKSVSLMSFWVLLVILSRAVLEGVQMFWVTSFMKLIIGILIVACPLVYLVGDVDLIDVFDYLGYGFFVIAIIQSIIVYYAVIKNNYISFSTQDLKLLLGSGGLVMISGVLMLVLNYFDRYIVGCVMGLDDVSSYTVVLDVIMRANVFVWAIISVLYPYFSEWYMGDNLQRLTRVYVNGMKVSLLFFSLIGGIIVVFGYDLVGVWISYDFAENSKPVVRLMGLGMAYWMISIISSRLLIAINKEYYLVLILFVEVVLYIACLMFFGKYGLVSVAFLYVIKCVVHCLCLYYLASRFLGISKYKDGIFPAIFKSVAFLLFVYLISVEYSRDQLVLYCLVFVGYLVWFMMDKKILSSYSSVFKLVNSKELI